MRFVNHSRSRRCYEVNIRCDPFSGSGAVQTAVDLDYMFRQIGFEYRLMG